MSIGENIVRIRKSINMSAAELCRLTNITSAYMSQIEKDKRTPTIDVLQRIAKELNVTVSDLLGETAINLPEEQLQLLEQTKDMKPEQVKALIGIVDIIKKDLLKSSAIHIDRKTNTPTLVSKEYNMYEARAAHYEGEEGLNEEEQSAIQSEIDKIKEQYNPDGTPRNKK